MRELKFRVWDDEQKKFEYFELHNITIPDRLLIQHKFLVQQYTGLIDKNGVEIYEGDILTYTSSNGLDYEAPVVFSTTTLAYVLDTSGRHLFDDKYGDYLDLHKDREYTVVGNIFENPELLSA